MLKFRSSSLRSAAVLVSPAAAAAAQPRVRLSTGPQQKHTTFYEFRTYSIRPDQNAAFLKLTNEKIHLRTAHSELIGYWTVEYGGLNKVFHIWKYDSYAQRAAVRAALAQDPSWISEYISKAMPMLTSQDNEVTYLVPWSHLQKPPQEGGVYELVSFQMRPGGPAVWGNAFQAAVTTHDAPGYGKLVGAFSSEFGLLNRVHALWWFESADQRAEVRHKAHTDARVVAAVRNSVVHLDSQENKLMFPCSFSPLKFKESKYRFSKAVRDAKQLYAERQHQLSATPPMSSPTSRPSQHPGEGRQTVQEAETLQSSWLDSVSPSTLKNCADQLSPVPACFKASTIIPVYKKPRTTGLNNYRAVALTSVVMKSFDRLLLSHLKSITDQILDPLQFAYRANRSVDDAVNVALHYILQHLDSPGTYARILFVDFSSAFNTIIPALLQDKLSRLNVPDSTCRRITDFLTDRKQHVKLGKHVSDSRIISTKTSRHKQLLPVCSLINKTRVPH